MKRKNCTLLDSLNIKVHIIIIKSKRKNNVIKISLIIITEKIFIQTKNEILIWQQDANNVKWKVDVEES